MVSPAPTAGDTVAPRQTLLFFGDSITRGFGVGRDARFASRIEAAIPVEDLKAWQIAVAYGRSHGPRYKEGLDAALQRYQPRILVCQCPIGAILLYPEYPLWIRLLQRLFGYFFHWRRERLIHRELTASPQPGRTRNHVIYEGTYLQDLHRFKPSVIPGLRALRARLVQHYIPPVQMPARDYLTFMRDLDKRARELGVQSTVFLGLLPMRDDYYQGYQQRAVAWNQELRSLHEPQQSRYFIDLYAAMASLPPAEMLLLDGTHPSVQAHRLIGELMLPHLLPLLRQG